ncbi:hypothetical protein BSZ35_12775 [Salinibacter sp. 10B]|uniref:2TM domain-containing protein n=1 Tax=Salinibacter sp. 10B TaxID=1923971 RepID=UPI000D2BA352|nr:2TM domain-containing protein [Salinibacter sp. 10B]PQJ35356.1 hypothetical protein BSZ35_12775 [Salinibacter sp. 10B]
MCSFPHAPFHSSDAPRKGFLAHLVTYLTVNIGLLLINLLTTPDVIWAIWPLFGWGLGVLSHGLRLLANDTFPSVSPSGQTTSTDTPDWTRVEKRLQNLEAIAAEEDLEAPQSSSAASTRTGTAH